MATYHAPVRDMKFVLHEMLDAEQAFSRLGFDEASADLVDHVLDEAGRFCEEAVFPTNRAGDEEGCVFENGVVRTPAGFKQAYRQLAEGGWISLACDPDYGGQGLPEALNFFVEEMLGSANVAFSLYPGLTHGAYILLHDHGEDELKRRFLPKMVDGTWTGTMCLTEPHCGTDLGLIRTKAVPREDGSYGLSGTKIFITCGEHDLAENIIHLVLAKLPDAPAGTRGISLFLVPKFLPDDDGAPGDRNGATCVSIEHKMGINGSSTCEMSFEDATGWLVGEPHGGLRAMFTMMNHERVAVGIQGLSCAETAYQSAADYARERLQGRAPGGARFPDRAADPIIVHPDVRRMLLTTRAFTEGARALVGWTALRIDESERERDGEARERAADLVALMTPVVKAFLTDLGSECCNLCLQVFGGHGYIREWGIEQLVRDVRISQIYEGTNGVQAMDLIGRKLPMHGGRLIERYFEELERFIEECRAQADADGGASGCDAGEFLEPLASARDTLVETTRWIQEESRSDPALPGAVAVEYLHLLGLVALAHMWAWAAQAASARADGDGREFYAAKLATARFYMHRMLPRAAGLAAGIRGGSRPLMELEVEAF